MRLFGRDLNNYDLNSIYSNIVEEILRTRFNADKVCKINSKDNFYGFILEKLGIDYIIEKEEENELFRKFITIQVKIRDPKYYMKDICIEVMHESLNDPSIKSLGYIFDIKADYLLYMWQDRSEALMINVNKLKEYFWLNKSRYKLIPTKGTYTSDKKWITYNMFIPLEDLPKCYEKIML